jgi:hypothetical protein
MEVEYKQTEDGMIQFECTDADGTVYGIADSIENGIIVDTLVVNMETYDEIEDSELFKRIVTARSIFAHENYIVQEALNELSTYDA